MRRCTLVTFILVCCFAGLAVAGEPGIDAREVLQVNGYDGIWSMDCSRIPTDQVPRINWFVPDHGPVQQWVDIGRGYYLEGIVSGASVTPDGRFKLSVNSLRGSSWTRTTIRIDDKTIRIWEASTRWQGHTSITAKNGQILRDGMRSPPIEKCDELAALTS